MDYLSVEFLLAVVVFLLALSEFLGLFPAVKSNSVFQLIVNVLKKIKDVVKPDPSKLKL